MIGIRNIFLFLGLTIGCFVIAGYCESQKEPYEEGIHLDYAIICENGFIYKSLGGDRGTIQVLNSDGTPLKCGEKIH
jgi:hypothetical protein